MPIWKINFCSSILRLSELPRCKYFYNSPVLGTRSAMALRAAILLAGEILLLVDSRLVGDVVCSR